MDTKNKNSNTLSPTPAKPQDKVEDAEVLIDFSQAVGEMLLGKKIHKLDWKDREYYGMIGKDNVLGLHKPDESFERWSLSRKDLEGTDYTVIK